MLNNVVFTGAKCRATEHSEEKTDVAMEQVKEKMNEINGTVRLGRSLLFPTFLDLTKFFFYL